MNGSLTFLAAMTLDRAPFANEQRRVLISVAQEPEQTMRWYREAFDLEHWAHLEPFQLGGCRPSAVFQSEIVVHGMAEFLLAAEIPLGCLNRCVSQQKLNLLKFSACEMA